MTRCRTLAAVLAWSGLVITDTVQRWTLGIKNVMSVAKRKEFDELLKNGELQPIREKTIVEIMLGLAGQAKDFVGNAACEVFDILRPHGHWGGQYATDLCEYPFGTGGPPPATGPDSLVPKFGCDVQRPGMNSTVSVAANGRYVVHTYANNAQGAEFIVDVASNGRYVAHTYANNAKLPVAIIALTVDTGDTISIDGLAVYWARDAASRIYVSYEAD